MSCPKSCLLVCAVAIVVSLTSVAATPKYDEATAIRNMMFAGASYCKALRDSYPTYPAWNTLSADCVQQAPDFEITGTFYDRTVDGFGIVGVSHTQQLVVASFKGTDAHNMADVRIDATNVFSFPDSCSLGGVEGPAHAGFCLEYHGIKEVGIFDAVVTLHKQFPEYKVICTGHSLGGALAAMLAIDLMSSQSMPVSVYTYGQPRTFASGLALQYYSLMDTLPSSEMFRVTHYKDVVPHMPNCKKDSSGACVQDNIHGYHTGYEIHYNKDMSHYTECSKFDSEDCNEIVPIGVNDHLYYFNYRVSTACCPDPSPPPSPPNENSEDSFFSNDSSDDNDTTSPAPEQQPQQPTQDDSNTSSGNAGTNDSSNNADNQDNEDNEDVDYDPMLDWNDIMKAVSSVELW